MLEDPDATRINDVDPSPVNPGRTGPETGVPGRDGPDGGDPDRWSARANVPAPDRLRPAEPQEWIEVEEDPYQGRSWLRPVIIGVIALVLASVLAVGLYLIYRSADSAVPAPVDSVTAVAPATSAPVPTRTAAPTTAPATSAAPPPTSAAAPTRPAGVVIPPLHGATLAEATIKLQQLGLQVRTVRRVDTTVQPGEVFQVSPGEGETVAPGDVITLYIAVAPSPAPSASRS